MSNSVGVAVGGIGVGVSVGVRDTSIPAIASRVPSIHLASCSVYAITVDSIHLASCSVYAITVDSIHLASCSVCVFTVDSKATLSPKQLAATKINSQKKPRPL
jgi:hypothetical protein